MFCSNCGKEISAGAAFCSGCKTAIDCTQPTKKNELNPSQGPIVLLSTLFDEGKVRLNGEGKAT